MEANGKHYQITNCPQSLFFWQLSNHETHNGNISTWFRQKIHANPAAVPIPCWCSQDGNLLCNGVSLSLRVCISIPIMLVLEAGIHISGNHSTQEATDKWNFPWTLRPATKDAADQDGVIYDIVGRVFASHNHFIT